MNYINAAIYNMNTNYEIVYLGQHDSSTASPLQQHTLLTQKVWFTNNHWF